MSAYVMCVATDQSLLAARPPSNPGFMYGTNNSATPPVTQYHHAIGPTDSPVMDHAGSPHHFGAGSGPAGYHQPGPSPFYGPPQRASPASFGFADQHAVPGAFLVSSSSQPEETCPAPIPLPSEVARGQSLTMADFESQELAAAALVSNSVVVYITVLIVQHL